MSARKVAALRSGELCLLRLLLGICAATLLGCSQGADVVEVSGKLTRNGKPLPNYAVTFHPTKGRTSVAVTDSNGNFDMVYTRDLKGVIRGKHKVYVLYAPQTTSYNNDMSGAPADMQAINEKYGSLQTTKYEIDVDGPKKNLEIKLD